MTKEETKPKDEKKEKVEVKPEKKEEKKAEAKNEEKMEKKTEEKTEKKEEKTEKVEEKPVKAEEKEIKKKEDAITKSLNLHLSKKHCMYICKFIMKKKIEEAIRDLELVTRLKKVVPFKGEIPHRKGKGMMSGRYPVKAAAAFINILKSLRGNIIVNGLDLEKTRIYIASASGGARPMRTGGRQGKRSNVILKAKEFKK